MMIGVAMTKRISSNTLSGMKAPTALTLTCSDDSWPRQLKARLKSDALFRLCAIGNMVYSLEGLTRDEIILPGKGVGFVGKPRLPRLLTEMPRVSSIKVYHLPVVESINGGRINSKGLGFLTPCFISRA